MRKQWGLCSAYFDRLKAAIRCFDVRRAHDVSLTARTMDAVSLSTMAAVRSAPVGLFFFFTFNGLIFLEAPLLSYCHQTSLKLPVALSP